LILVKPKTDGKGRIVTRSKILLTAVAASAALLGVAPFSASTARADGPSDEQTFIGAVRQLPTYTWPKGRDTTDADMLAGGYAACAVMDQHPALSDGMTAAKIYYNGSNAMYRDISGAAWDFMTYAASYLCERHRDMYPQLSEEGLFEPGGPYGPPG
jgi:hypothetical protein